jgi:hypothetical protein
MRLDKCSFRSNAHIPEGAQPDEPGPAGQSVISGSQLQIDTKEADGILLFLRCVHTSNSRKQAPPIILSEMENCVALLPRRSLMPEHRN